MWDLSSLIRDQTRDPWIVRWILYHWTTREVPGTILFKGLRLCWTLRKRYINACWSSLAVQWLGLCAEGLASVPARGAKIPQAVWLDQKKKKKVFEIKINQRMYNVFKFFNFWPLGLWGP